MQPSKHSGSIRYGIFGAVIIIVAGVALFLTHSLMTQRALAAVNERNNVLLARVLANVVWPEIRGLATRAHTLTPDALKKDKAIAATRAQVRAVAKDIPLLKVKIFDLDGLTVFSTDPTQIGEKKTDYPGFVAARSGRVASIESERKTFAGLDTQLHNRHVLSSYVPVFDKSGKVDGVFEIYTDVTEPVTQLRNMSMLQLAVAGLTFLLLYEVGLTLIRHRDRTIAGNHAQQLRLAEKAVAAEEASRTKSALLANMSHELRTPLNAVLGFAETIRLQPFGPIGSSKYLTYIEDIWKSGRHLLGIVDNVLEMARIDNGKIKLRLAPITTADLIDGVVRQTDDVAGGPWAPIRVHIPGAPVKLVVDEKRLRQALSHLVSNALKFTPPHGSIEITASQTKSGEVRISITDTGIGMAPEDIAQAMIPFGTIDMPYATATQGARLGLPLARMLVELHGGTLAMDSVLGKGTSVTITLPSSCLASHGRPVLRADRAL